MDEFLHLNIKDFDEFRLSYDWSTTLSVSSLFPSDHIPINKMSPTTSNKSSLDTKINCKKCNDIGEKIISSMNYTDYSYRSQDHTTNFKETEIDYAINIHGNYMDVVMNIIYVD